MTKANSCTLIQIHKSSKEHSEQEEAEEEGIINVEEGVEDMVINKVIEKRGISLKLCVIDVIR